MEVVADPQIVGIAIFGRRGVLVLGSIGLEQRLVGLQQRAADAPDDIAQRPRLLGLQAADHHARSRGDRLDLDAGLLLEGAEHQVVQSAVVGRIDHDLLLRLGGTAGAQGDDQ